MFKRYQPVVPDLTIAVGNAYRAINLMSLLIDAGDTLEAMTESNIAIYGNTQISDGDIWCTFGHFEDQLSFSTRRDVFFIGLMITYFGVSTCTKVSTSLAL